MSPYLVLLRAGFCLPPVLPRARCALTAPFHPYPSHILRRAKGGMFSVPLSFRLPRPGVTRRTALRSSDFPPTSALRATVGKPIVTTKRRKADDRLSRCERLIVHGEPASLPRRLAS